jgi:hypothetical protein
VSEPVHEVPVLRVVRGAPDADELAALVAVVAAAGSAAAAARTRPTVRGGGWAAHDRTVRGPLPSGGWRTSTSPR